MAKEELFDAIDNNDINGFKAMLASLVGDEINTGDKDNYTLLHMAIDFGKEEFAKLLLNTDGCDVDCKTNFHDLTPLHFAAQDGRNSLVDLLLNFGANINALNGNNCTPLYMAVCSNRLETVKLLISRGADINIRDSHGMSPLLHAVSISAEMTKYLLDNNAQMSAYCRELHSSLLSNKADIANVILDQMEKMSLPLSLNKIGRSPLQNAVSHINCEDPQKAVNLIARLVNLGDDINHTNLYGTALHILIQRNAFSLTNNANITDDYSAKECFKYLLSRTDCDLNVYVSANGSGVPLTLAFKLNQYFYAEQLIKAGADISQLSLDDFRYTNGADRALKLLLYSGYKFKECFSYRCRPLDEAYNDQFDAICKWISSETNKIMSLRCIIRKTLRHMYGTKISAIINTMKVPTALQSFMLLDSEMQYCA